MAGSERREHHPKKKEKGREARGGRRGERRGVGA